MAMRSMSSAVNGLKAQQTAMDVIANNIANVNTSGFRSSSTNFEDMFYETLNGGTAETNPSQIGYGAEVADVSKNMTGGGGTSTNCSTDLYISGEGYFGVNTKPDGKGQTYFTRVGHFHFDPNGYLVDANGNYVLSNFSDATSSKPMPIQLQDMATKDAIATKAAGSVALVASDGTATELTTIGGTNTFSQLRDVTINRDGSISASIGSTTGTICEYDATAKAYSNEQVQLSTFLNDAGLQQEGSNYYMDTKASGPAAATTAGNGNKTQIQNSTLEMSNVDIAKEFTTMIQTQRGFQASSRVITTSDSLYEELVNLKRS